MVKILKIWIYRFYRVFLFSKGSVKIYKKGKNKSRITIIKDLLGWMLREKYFNEMYYALGLNLVGTKQDTYIGKNEFFSCKIEVEKYLKKKANCEKFSYDIITKDKFYANSILKANNINCVENIALLTNNNIIFNNGKSDYLGAILEFENTFFIKNTVLEAGDGVLHCVVSNNNIIVNGQRLTLEELKNKLGEAKWVVQLACTSHPEIQIINNSALNTTRIVTILYGSEPVYLTGFQSFATNNETTDSWGKGSIYVGIDVQNNSLKKHGYFHPGVGAKSIVDKHPDSGIVFEGYKISLLRDAVYLCIKAHKIFYFNFVIGWDVAITDNGPVILEANENPGMHAVQCVDGGLRYKIKNYYDKCFTQNKS